MSKLNILVTAVGSELAFSVIKAIKLLDDDYSLVGCDIYPEVVGKYWCDCFYQVPQAKYESEYLENLFNIVRKHNIKYIVPTADIEFSVLSKYKAFLWNEFHCHLLCNTHDQIELFNDKWKAYNYFSEKSIPTPKTYTVLSDSFDHLLKEKLNFPMIMKPRIGGGSRNIYKISSFDDVLSYSKIVPNPLIQEYIEPDEEEFTAGVFRTEQDQVFSIIMKRKLKFGMTNSGQVVLDSDLDCFCKETILKTNLYGANNIQFRINQTGPKVLEINPRFSGTTGIRAQFGYNEVKLWTNLLENGNCVKPIIKSGFFMRYMEEQCHF